MPYKIPGGKIIFKNYVKARLFKPLLLGFLIGVSGICINILPLGLDLEENFGLDLLFWLRGVRQAPSDVVIVSIDKESADALSLPDDPRKWPHSLHARLIEKLHSQGAAVVAFDVMFSEKHSDGEDRLLATALKKARNIVLSERMRVENIFLGEDRGVKRGEVSITKVETPIDPLLQSAAATAPFPIPRTANKVTQYWTFAATAAEKPTLPVVAFQIYAMQTYGDLLSLLREVSPHAASRLPVRADEIINNRGIEKLVRDLRHIFQNDPSVATKMHEKLGNLNALTSNVVKYRIIDSLVRIYAGDTNSRYINFYGPARTVTTIPYYRILNSEGRTSKDSRGIDMKGKAVFVGLSQLSPVDQKESFYTTYSESQGLDMSGIEIVATAFANLKEDTPIRPIDFRLYLAIIFLFGGLFGFICKKFSTFVSFCSILVSVTIYAILAVFAFINSGIWYPVITPVFLMPAVSLFCGLLWNHVDVKRERQNIRKALGFYLPDAVADQLAHNIEGIHSTHQIVFGICLSTDAEQYSALAEAMDPKDLGRFMNRYYETVFEPIKRHDGIISDVVGDSVLAIWIAPHPEKLLKYKACLAALDISKAIRKFNEEVGEFKLPTRIGLHSGNILLGNVGAIGHYEYRPVGDIVNTSTRIEGLNKYLNTRILVSRDVIGNLDGFVTREIGEFKLAGKTKPVVLYELICQTEESDDRQKKIGETFSAAVGAYKKRLWDQAIEGFQETIEVIGKDGPSDFYMKLCKHYKEHEPGELWNGVIHMEKK